METPEQWVKSVKVYYKPELCKWHRFGVFVEQISYVVLVIPLFEAWDKYMLDVPPPNMCLICKGRKQLGGGDLQKSCSKTFRKIQWI